MRYDRFVQRARARDLWSAPPRVKRVALCLLWLAADSACADRSTSSRSSTSGEGSDTTILPASDSGVGGATEAAGSGGVDAMCDTPARPVCLVDPTTCCPDAAQPCPVVNYDCGLDCGSPSFPEAVEDPLAAQCMLLQLADPSSIALRRSVPNGVGALDEYWFVRPDGGVTIVHEFQYDLAGATWTELCRIASSDTLAACAQQTDPALLGSCIGDAVADCVDTEQVCCPA
jgi:hypothetical protein